MKRQQITKFEIKYLIVLIVIAFIVIVIVEYRLDQVKEITVETRIDSVYLSKSNVSYHRRVTITIEDIGNIRSDLELISNLQGFNEWEYEPPLIKFSDYHYIPEIGHLPLPYIFFKQENSDTIVVRKDSFFLYFRFEDFKSLSQPDR